MNIRVNRVRTIGPRRNNRRIYFNLAREGFRKIKQKMGLNLGSKVLGSEIGKKLINKGIDSKPNIFKFGASKVKNKTVNRALNSEIADLVVNEAQKKSEKNTIAQTCLDKKWVEYQTFKLKKHFKKLMMKSF